ncbi:metal-dependent hydrolase [Zeaxanthinibacter enoshimensis]|uniref:metal-dependent hydrolase n=1 Tax=Zeaxanthinibacter enoshimensis TaxID=392009 RepID=UPI00356AE4AE
MKITFLGHACLLIHLKNSTILVDPFITGNDKAKDQVDISELQPDFILLTHAHQDHILDAETIARQSDATIVSNYEIASHYEAKGLKAHPMNHGGNWEFSFGKLKYVNAIHTSSFPDGSYGGQPGGFVLSADGKQVYIAGDTALCSDMKLIPLQFQLDLAILPIGDNFTMGIDDAVIAADFVDCDRVLGYHYDTFGYIEIDHKQALQAFTEAGKELYLMDIGASLEL